MEMAGESPTWSSAASAAARTSAASTFPFVREVLRAGSNVRFVAAEPSACPTLTRGVYRYDFGDTAGLTPLMPMYTLGHDFVPAAGPRRRPALPRRLAARLRPGQGRARRAAGLPPERDVRGRGPVRAHRGDHPGPEPAHAIRAVIEEAEAGQAGRRGARDPVRALRPRQLRPRRVRRVSRGDLEDPESSQSDLDAALAALPDAPALT